MEKRFTNRVVVVTGATKGIGLACAERLKNEGAIVCACLLYTSPSPRDMRRSRMPSSA